MNPRPPVLSVAITLLHSFTSAWVPVPMLRHKMKVHLPLFFSRVIYTLSMTSHPQSASEMKAFAGAFNSAIQDKLSVADHSA